MTRTGYDSGQTTWGRGIGFRLMPCPVCWLPRRYSNAEVSCCSELLSWPLVMCCWGLMCCPAVSGPCPDLPPAARPGENCSAATRACPKAPISQPPIRQWVTHTTMVAAIEHSLASTIACVNMVMYKIISFSFVCCNSHLFMALRNYMKRSSGEPIPLPEAPLRIWDVWGLCLVQAAVGFGGLEGEKGVGSVRVSWFRSVRNGRACDWGIERRAEQGPPASSRM